MRSAMRVSGATRGWLLAVVAAACWLPGVAQASDPENCLFCHQYRGLGRFDRGSNELHLFFIDPTYHDQKLGPHARIGCTDCHERSEVAVIPHNPVSKVNCTQACHLQDPDGIERFFTHENVARMLEQSVHTSELLDQVKFAKGPVLAEDQSRCLYCHDEPLFRDPSGAIPAITALGGRVFDRCDVCHLDQVPADIAYYVRHIASRLQVARPSLEMGQVCALCHGDPKVMEDYNLSNATASYVRSFHGKAALLGDETTANCVSCHVRAGQNAHLMLGPQDPQSSVSPERVVDACRSAACHPGADKALASAGVHLDLPNIRGTLEYALAAAFIVLTVLTFGPSMVIVVLELFEIAVGQRHAAEHKTERLAAQLWRHPVGRLKLTRFTVPQRVQHWVLAFLFAMLAITGFPLKFAGAAWAGWVIDRFGGLSNARFVHHWAGIALVLGFAMHAVAIVYWMFKSMRSKAPGSPRGLIAAVTSLPMWIGPDDVKKFAQLLLYLMRLRKEKPTFGRFSVKEKFEYIGVFWGTTLLGITGILLWGEQIATQFVSGRVLNIAIIAHTYEAFLAIIHVGILHIINVIFAPNVFPLSWATISGKTPLVELAEGHSEQVLAVAQELGYAIERGAQDD